MEHTLDVHSIFSSVDGEVNYYGQGRPTTFIRLNRCNLRCQYCDTVRAQKPGLGLGEMEIAHILGQVIKAGTRKVTITGGEPLLQTEGLMVLVKELRALGQAITIETNGTQAINWARRKDSNLGPYWIVDWKLPSAHVVRSEMNREAFRSLEPCDYVKFVIATKEDFEEATSYAIPKLDYWGCRATLAFGPCEGGEVLPAQLIAMMHDAGLSHAVLNVQLHKLINLKEDG